MKIQAYDFVTGIETAAAPVPEIADSPGDVYTLGNFNRFTVANNTGPANVTGCVFDKTVYRAVWIKVAIYRSASGGSTRAQTISLRMITDGTNWEIDVSGPAVPSSDDAGVDFTVTSAGQLQYTSDDNGGSYSAANSYIDWKIEDLSEVAA